MSDSIDPISSTVAVMVSDAAPSLEGAFELGPSEAGAERGEGIVGRAGEETLLCVVTPTEGAKLGEKEKVASWGDFEESASCITRTCWTTAFMGGRRVGSACQQLRISVAHASTISRSKG